ncbi:hypothetical protein F5B22DRAFT_628520 [Xylaria bambusicola]|uniref:uncharacterized protein n=1 Tax=Xylaria bambusicola TaxID=326684 RepID=UPI00200881BD|nr:uncharacterized protein F5B22DRAFT_628520 [Xylaria bambusicola]KAI0505190.1 hypothetical protein F5B22DRAFT_628520 [Xylaria bambusicola]
MSTSVIDHTWTWLDGTSASSHKKSIQLDWPLSNTGTNETISGVSSTGNITVCKSLPGKAFIGPDKHKRAYLVKHRKYNPILPRMLLHQGPDDSSPVWAKYEALALRKAWVEIPCQCTGATIHGRVEVLRKRDGRRNKYVFTMVLEGREETFGWRRSKNKMIKDLGLSHNGYKLVRLTERAHASSSSPNLPRASDRMEVVALAGRSHHVFPRCMAAKFLTSFGPEWEVVSFMTLLAFWLWDRKRMMKG